MSNLLIKIKPVFFLLLILSIIGLALGEFFIYQKIRNSQQTSESTSKLTSKSFELEKVSDFDSDKNALTCSSSCQDEIEKIVSNAIATLSGQTSIKTIETKTVVVQTLGGTDFIPLGGTTTTQNTDWVDVDESAVYIDLVNDYRESATVSWEISLKVAHGNGKAFARLWDDTNKIAVDGSELSTENNVDYTQVTSGNLPFWRGRNLYKVQIKSLNGFEITYSGGKIKVSY